MLSYLCGTACGLNIQYGSVSTVGGEGAEWSTLSVNLTTDNTNNHNYIYVNYLFILTLLYKYNKYCLKKHKKDSQKILL